jgi:hypothetical protein
MSGYFDALMRASGRMAAIAERPGFAAEEHTENAMLQPTQLPPSPVEPPARAHVPARAEKRGEMAAPLSRAESKSSAESSQDDGLPLHVSLSDPVPVSRQPGAVAESPEQGIARQNSPTSQADAPKGIELVRAALRWVASDPSLIADAAQPRRPPDAASPVRIEPTHALQPLDPQREMPPAERPAKTVPPPAPKPITVDETRARSRGNIEVPQASEPRRRIARSVPASEADAVEVSIGTIHIKVDPPASSQATSTSPPPAPRHTAPRHITPRSSLARRLLRRL